jgi:hypothetical protein
MPTAGRGSDFRAGLGSPFYKPHRRRKKKAWAIAAPNMCEARPPHCAYATTKHLRLLDCYYIGEDCARSLGTPHAAKWGGERWEQT